MRIGVSANRRKSIVILDGDFDEEQKDHRPRLLTIVVSGGGISGVEAVAEINDFVRGAARSYRKLRVATDWCLDTVLPMDIVQLKITRSASVSQDHFGPGETIFSRAIWETGSTSSSKGRWRS